MVYYFVGEDTYAARQAIGKIAAEKKAQVRWLDRADLQEKSLQQWSDQAAGGLFSVEILVVRDPSAMPKAIQENITKLDDKLPAVCILWDRVTPDKRSVLYKKLKSYQQEFVPPPFNNLVKWLQEEAASRKSGLAEPAARELVVRLGLDRWRLLSELEKLSLVHQEITLAVVHEAVAPAEATPEIFVILDAIAAGQTRAALTAMELMLRSGASELYILSMLAYQFKTLLAIKNGLDKRLTGEQIAREAKLHPYVVKKNLAAAGQYTAAALLGYLTRIMAADFAIKQGKVDQRTGLIMLMTSLAGK